MRDRTEAPALIHAIAPCGGHVEIPNEGFAYAVKVTCEHGQEWAVAMGGVGERHLEAAGEGQPFLSWGWPSNGLRGCHKDHL